MRAADVVRTPRAPGPAVMKRDLSGLVVDEGDRVVVCLSSAAFLGPLLPRDPRDSPRMAVLGACLIRRPEDHGAA